VEHPAVFFGVLAVALVVMAAAIWFFARFLRRLFQRRERLGSAPPRRRRHEDDDDAMDPRVVMRAAGPAPALGADAGAPGDRVRRRPSRAICQERHSASA